MKSNIYWDLDGVLRDLNTPCFGRQAPTWDHKQQGEGLVEKVFKNPEILVMAPALSYLRCANTPEILSVSQPVSWWTGCTLAWCEKNIKTSYSLTFFKSFHDKLDYLGPRDVLIEDCPEVAGDPRVWLIDRPYNRMVVPASGVRIKSVKQLKEKLCRLR